MRQSHNSFHVILLGFLVLLIAGCNSFTTQPSVANADSANPQQLPFTEVKPLVVPADTVIYVHLKEPLSATDAEAGQDFPAVLDQALLVDNQVVASQGCAVSGKVVAARGSGHLHRAGYVRIRLSSIFINGKQFPLATNSMMAAGGSIHSRGFSFLAGANSFRDTGDREAGFTPEQRLGFRLTQPLTVTANQNNSSPL